MTKANFTLKKTFYYLCSMVLIGLLTPFLGVAQTFTGAGTPVAIPDPGTVTSAATSSLTGVIGTDYRIESVKLDITHTFDGDLDITLIAPSGASVDLSIGNGSAGDNYNLTVFEDGGADITAAASPFTGTFQAEGGIFSVVFAGEPVNGDWTLSIDDTFGGDGGTLNSYSITFGPANGIPLLGQACGTGSAGTPIIVPDDGFDDDDDNSVTLAEMVDFSTAVSGIPVGATITNITAVVPFNATWVGDVALVLEAPDGTLLPLMTRPGAVGTGGAGDSSDGSVNGELAPLFWTDNGDTDAEDMGATIAGGDIVGLDDGNFDYAPNGDGLTITGAGAQVATFADLFAQSDALNGTWTIHMGDATGGDATRLLGLQVCVEYDVSILASGIDIVDPCTCLDNATPIDMNTGTGGDDGQFSETVAIPSIAAGRFFKVTSIAGAIDLVTGLPVSVGADLTYNAVDQRYEISFAHVDNVGYAIRVREHDALGQFFGPELGIANKCAYPNPTFVPVLDDVYCNFEAAVALGGDAVGGADAVTFTINGNPATDFDPVALGNGTHTVVMSYDGAADANGGVSPNGGITAALPGCIQEVTMDVDVNALNVGCISSVNVTLDPTTAACNAEITPQMVLTGDYSCIDNFIVTIDDIAPPTSKVTGCRDNHTYMVQLFVNGNNTPVHTCWGTVVAEDKTPPVVVCPPNTNQGLSTRNLQLTAVGSLDGTGPTFNLGDYSCYSDVFTNLVPGGPHEYDLVTFTPSATDIYTFITVTNFPSLGGIIALYQGNFDPNNPCQNIVGNDDNTYFGDPTILQSTTLNGPTAFDPAYRTSLPLRAGQHYTLLVTSFTANTIGDWLVVAQSDSGNSLSVGDFGAPFSVQNLNTLVCTDIDSIQIIGQAQYVVNGNGNTVPGTMSTDLRKKLIRTGFPTITDNCGQMLVTVSDVVSAAGDCGDVTLTRTFSATDHYNAAANCTSPELTAFCTQTITFRKLTVADVVLPPFTAPIECDEDFALDANGNPVADVTGYPWVQTAFANHSLADDYCNIGASYSDEPRIDVCPGTYKFRREWNIIDWCDTGNSFIWDVIVKVGNYTGPVVTWDIENNNGSNNTRFEISTSPFSCTANWRLPYVNADANCDPNDDFDLSQRLVTILRNDPGHVGEFVWAGREITAGQATVVQGLEIGRYTATWCISDDCGNETCKEWALIVTDEIAPTASCNDQLNVSIGGGDIHNGIEGIARINAIDVNEASYDNCEIDHYEIRRNKIVRGSDLIWFTEDDQPSTETRWSPWGYDYINFYCFDVGVEITIELRAYDIYGNFNTCWFTVTPEDKLIPYCYAPANQQIFCNDLPEYFPGDLALAYSTDPAGTHEMMDLLFGYAWGTDNCIVDSVVERSPNIGLNDCGWGRIIRRFEIWQSNPDVDNYDGDFRRNEAWVSSNTCSQVIDIDEVHEYRIEFPQDASADCADPCVWDIITETTGCDVLAVNRGEPVRFSATGDECYKMSITYDVINWCIWDGEYEGYTIVRKTESDNQFALDRAVESAERPILTGGSYLAPSTSGPRTSGVFLDRDHDDRYPGNILNPGNDLRRADCQYDADGNPTAVPTFPRNSRDNSRLAEAHSWNDAVIDDQGLYPDADGTGPGGHFGHLYEPDLNRGRWNYTQFIKVYDSTVPVVDVPVFGGPTDECPELEDNQFGDPYGVCSAAVSVPFTVSDDCELLDTNNDLVISIVSAELGLFVVDANGDGVIKANEFIATSNIQVTVSNTAVNGITDFGDGTYVYTASLPIIPDASGATYHAIKVVLEDGCGNTTNEIIRIDVVDCKGPAPICINGLTVTLMPVDQTLDNTDIDGDGDDDLCAMAIWANDFEGSPIYDCTGQGPETNGNQLRVHKYAIYRFDEVDGDPETFVPDVNHTGTIFTDDDLVDGFVTVYVYAFDQDGNYDFCTTGVQVEAHVTCGTTSGTLSGVISTETGDDIAGVEVNVNGESPVVTGNDGFFTFQLTAGLDYTLTPYLNADPLNGVSTFDLVLMSKHILGVDLLDSPYKRIAADVNRSETITTLDMIQLRKLILNIDTEFSNNTSWRFIPADFDFADNTNPWAGDGFVELISINNLPLGDVMLDANFVGVKTGDVSGNAVANLLSSDDRTLNGQFNFNVENTDVKAGNIYTVAFTAADIASVKGYQATLALAGAELVDIEYGVATAENFGLRFADQGMITTSWNGEATSDDVLFSLVLRATADAQLSDVIKVSSRYTAAEAYDNNNTMNVGINFSGVGVVDAGFELYQNTPNPFQTETMIGFNLPVDAKATITISDISGRVLTVLYQDATAGYNQVKVIKAMINNTTGVLSYTVTAGDFSATKSMIVVK